MAVSHRRQLQFWGVGTLVFILLMWLLGDTLLPFFAVTILILMLVTFIPSLSLAIPGAAGLL